MRLFKKKKRYFFVSYIFRNGVNTGFGSFYSIVAEAINFDEWVSYAKKDKCEASIMNYIEITYEEFDKNATDN